MITRPNKAMIYSRDTSLFEVLRTEKAVEISEKLEELTEVVKGLKEDKKELISKLDETNELLALLVKNSTLITKPTSKKNNDIIS